MELKWNKLCSVIRPTISVKVTKEDVLGIICSAVNGGVGYWAAVSANDNDYSEAKKHLVEQGISLKDVCYEEVFSQILFDGKELEITDIEKDMTYFLSLNKLNNGIKKAIEEGYYSHYNWFIPEGDGFGEWQLETSNVDGAVADIIVQFSLFDEVLFG